MLAGNYRHCSTCNTIHENISDECLFLDSQFSYSLLIWMCHSRTLNNKINSLQERCLRLIYNNE